MARILATAENYAFGPVGKLVTVCKYLAEMGHHIIFVGEGTAYQLASKANFGEVHKLDTDSSKFEEEAENLFKNADVLLSSVDRSSVLFAKKVGLPVIWLDMLFWWWDSVPDYLYDIELYIQQNSIRNKRNMKLFGDKIRNMVVVGPIIDTSFKDKTERKNQLLVGFGGLDAAGWYKIGKDSFYPYTLTKMTVEQVDTNKYDNVLFAGNEEIMEKLKTRYGNDRFQFRILSHDEWLQEIAASRDILINPGLEAPLEAMVYERPVFFLPPYNSSAYVELDEFRKQKVANKSNSIHFSDYFPRRNYLGRDLREIMEEFLKELKVFENSEDILKNCSTRINKYLESSDEIKQRQIKYQRRFIKSIGNNGIKETVDTIDKLVEKLASK